MQQLQQQNVRPISTYDNLSNNTAKPRDKQQQQQQQQSQAGESSGQLEATPLPLPLPQPQSPSPSPLSSQLQSAAAKENASLLSDTSCNGIQIIPATRTKSPDLDLNETSHSIAAVRAALSDAKSKFFGINNYEIVDAAARSAPESKAEPKYQNVPQPAALRMSSTNSGSINNAPDATTPKSLPPERTLRYGTTYEQIPLSDLDAPQPSQVSTDSICPVQAYLMGIPQAVYMSTTVPQNMKGMKIAGRHTPTRNSLRHSRMIVVNNKPHDSELMYPIWHYIYYYNIYHSMPIWHYIYISLNYIYIILHTFAGIQETYSAHIRNSNLSRQVLILQLAIGLLIMALACWIFIMEPHASLQVNPYLSGLFVSIKESGHRI